MKFEKLNLEGCYLVHTDRRSDERGFFVKTFHRDIFKDSLLGEVFDFPEDFYSVSHPGVLRGLHFQKPPVAHHKLVFCLEGEILDVGLDLRATSPTFGKSFQVPLSAESGSMIFLPRGIAHGFYVPKQSRKQALVYYKVSTMYDPGFDTGVRWNSAGISWPDSQPIVSGRDSSLPEFSSYGAGLKF